MGAEIIAADRIEIDADAVLGTCVSLKSGASRRWLPVAGTLWLGQALGDGGSSGLGDSLEPLQSLSGARVMASPYMRRLSRKAYAPSPGPRPSSPMAPRIHLMNARCHSHFVFQQIPSTGYFANTPAGAVFLITFLRFRAGPLESTLIIGASEVQGEGEDEDEG